MNQLVIENGTLLDRIDANLEKAQVNINKGKRELNKVNLIEYS